MFKNVSEQNKIVGDLPPNASRGYEPDANMVATPHVI